MSQGAPTLYAGSFPHIRDVQALGSPLGAEIVEGGTPMELTIGRPLEGPSIVSDDLTGRPHEPSVPGWLNVTCRYRFAIAPRAASDFIDVMRPRRDTQAKRNEECQYPTHWNPPVVLHGPVVPPRPQSFHRGQGLVAGLSFAPNPSKWQRTGIPVYRSACCETTTTLEKGHVKNALAVKAEPIRSRYSAANAVCIRRRSC